ncbi:hypothetical protein [Streptococcus equinus]|uniref:hypothetical protein n=1 Tax=Streptococcus equinus TaxID=1335 RepID=UPI0008D68928|nr:hypothetical protein [Streptococcus equinus]QBX15864.1 tail fiber protein [Streptococcus phage Javan221]SEI63633.1 hypothetical protein SAMN05216423_0898 [Streptococcus equinus]
MSQNTKISTSGVSEFNQNIETGEISYKVANVSDALFGRYTNSVGGVYYASQYGVKIPVVQGKDVLVSLTDDKLIKNYVMFWGEDNKLAKQTVKYATNQFKIPASQLEDVSFLTFRFGVKENTQEIGTLIKTKVKIEYGNAYTDWSPAPEDLGWSTSTLVPTQSNRYLWKFEYIYYSDGSVEVTQPVNLSIAGADADTTGVTDAINQTNQTVASLQSSVSQAQSDLAAVSSSLTQARQNLESSIASVNTKAQAVETTLAQVQSTANANSQKTATLENDLNGLSARFSNLKIGGRNLLAKTNQGKTNWSWAMAAGTNDVTIESVDVDGVSAVKMSKGDGTASSGWNMITYSGLLRKLIEPNTQYTLSFDVKTNVNARFTATLMQADAKNRLTNSVDMGTVLADAWTRISCVLTSVATLPESIVSQVVYLQGMPVANGSTVMFKNIKLEQGNIATDYSPNETDLELKVADYKQTAEQNYASLQSTVQALDGTVTANKATADQTAAGFKTRIESLETYKDGESTRASQYFESAKTETARQLTAERTAIAKDYVAKSTYTSDVTGIRNDLTATTTTADTTKTNLANYQASNDKAVASLQSNLQTANGNISSLQTKVEAVPGQITSAVSAVEGKIPTEIGGRNLYALSKEIGRLGAKGGASNLALDVVNGTLSFDVNGAHPYFGECVWNGISYARSFGQLIPVKENSAIAISFTSADFNENYVSFVANGKGAKGPKVFRTQKVTIEPSELDGVEYIVVRGGINNGDDSLTGETVTTKIKVEYSNVYTDWSPAPEDTANQISNLSSQIQQTADGMTLLATKTELNSAKTELQSGITTATSKADNAQATANSNAQTISTHTTQISALNTGLQAKVSQSDFDSLSGRVTSAESNLTATANQLSSQISSVSERIPSGEMNLIEYGRPDDNYNRYSGVNYVRHDYYYNGNYRCYALPNSTTNEVTFSTNRFKVERNTDYTLYFKGFADSKVRDMDVYYLARVKGSTSGWDGGQQLIRTRKLSSEHAEDVVITFNSGNYDEAFIRLDNNATTTDGQNAVLYFGDLSLKKGKSNNGWSPSLAELASARDLVTAKSEIKQTTDAITASVSSIQTAANTAQATANTAVSKADAAQAGVNTLDSTTVKSASLNLDNNGFVTKVGKTINGNKFATMIAQDANSVKIIADEMQITADMIVDGAVTAEKLNVNNLSAVNSNLGKIEGGSLLLQENKTASSSVDNWGTFNRPAHKQGLYMDNHGLASSGAIQRKNGSETTPTDMPLAVLQSGELRFLVVDYNDNLENVLHYGLSDPDYGAIRFEIDSELKRRLTMTSSGYLNFQASNYTDWIPLSQQGCEYMIQGRLVVVNYDVTYSQGGTHKIGDIPQEFVKKELMLTAKAWSITPNDKNFQLNADGGLHLLNADANVTYRGTLLFSY